MVGQPHPSQVDPYHTCPILNGVPMMGGCIYDSKFWMIPTNIGIYSDDLIKLMGFTVIVFVIGNRVVARRL